MQGEKNPSFSGALHTPGSGLRAQPCLPACAQDTVLLHWLKPANLLYQHQLTPLALHGDSAFGEGMLSLCPSTLLRAPREGSWALPHCGVVAVVPIPSPGHVVFCLWWPLGMHHALPCHPFHWWCCSCCPSPSHCPVLCCMHGQRTNSSQPFPSREPSFPATHAYSSAGGYNELLSCLCSFSSSRGLEEEEDEETGLSMKLWGRTRHWQWAGWLQGTGLHSAQAMPAAAEPVGWHTAYWCLLQKVLQLMGICSGGTWQLARNQARGKGSYLPSGGLGSALG